MSFVVDQVRRIDSQLDRLQLLTSAEPWHPTTLSAEDAHNPAVAGRIEQLQSLIKTLSTTSTPKTALIGVNQIHEILRDANVSGSCSTCRNLQNLDAERVEAGQLPDSSYEHELEWLLISKATIQAYGQILNTLLDQTIPLGEDIFYWDDILSSYRYAGLYSIQTSPIRFWNWSKDVYHDVLDKRGGSVGESWQQFYGLVKDVVREKSIAGIQQRVVSPVAMVRNEARKKQSALKRLRLMNANALGVLLGEGLSNGNQDDGIRTPPGEFDVQEYQHKWKTTVAKSIALMEAVLQNAMDPELQVDKLDDAIASSTSEDPLYEPAQDDSGSNAGSLKPALVSKRLQNLLSKRLPQYTGNSTRRAASYARPSFIVRYWLPLSIALVSSSTALRILANRKAEVITWIREFGATVIDFWSNWVIEPTKKVIGTIRHDENSEVAIMSKRSLDGDRDSLERMVISFIADYPEGQPLTQDQIQDARIKVHEGDLTPVLKAYERDMQSPFKGAIMGNLVRELLIQVQKTKVDIEVAMGGIDSLLKSQELVFGLVGLTPGILVCIGVGRWLNGLFGARKGNRQGKQQTQLLRMLRNIDRILVGAKPTDFGELLYKDHGLLVCEVHMLRQGAYRVLPTQQCRDLLEELDDLLDIRTGVKKQMKVVKRIRWAYSRWF